jgi:hypothetical protein
MELLLPKNGVREGISTIVAIAVVCVAGIAGGVVYLYPSIIGGKTITVTSVTAQVGNSTSYSTTTYLPPANSTSMSSTAQPAWQAWAVANATLGYYKTQAFVSKAWNYTFYIYQSGNGFPGIFTVANIVTLLDLNTTGNWTSRYTLTYTAHVLNITVEYHPPSTYYPVFFFNSQNHSNIVESIRFNATQQQAISIALANSSVKQALSQFTYYVDDAFTFPAGNKTFGGDYLIWFFQTNGPKVIGAFVNMSSGAVVSTYATSRVTRTCYPNGVCFSSPWGYP